MTSKRKLTVGIQNKLSKLSEIVTSLQNGNSLSDTKLTVIKGLCSKPEIASHFVFYLIKRIYAKLENDNTAIWRYHRWLFDKAMNQITIAVEQQVFGNEGELYESYKCIQLIQNIGVLHGDVIAHTVVYPVGITVEHAMCCLLYPDNCGYFCYLVAQDYAKQNNTRYGSELIPQSADLVNDIVEFFYEWYGMDPVPVENISSL